MDSLIFELQIVFYFPLFLSPNVRHTIGRPLQTTDRGSGDPTRQQSVEYIFRGERGRRRSKEGRIGPVWRYIFTVEVFFLKV